jgi:5-methylcytosine-specific restriction endonuclease McrA
VASKDGRYIHSVRRAYPLPSVIRLSSYIRVPFKKIELSRKNILRRDEFRCQYCGAKGPDLTIDHIIPKARGGTDTWDNLVSACKKCNNKKGNRTPEEAGMTLHTKVNKPHHIFFIRQFMGKMDEKWKPFLFLD